MKPAAGIIFAAALGTLGWVAIVVLLWLLVGCEATGGNQSPHAQQGAPHMETPGTPVFPVLFTIVERTDGTGNAMWTRDYARALLAEASSIVNNVVVFKLLEVNTVEHDAQYRQTQRGLLAMYTGHGQPGVINVIISRPDTEDSAGRSNALYAHTPLMVMRARPGDTVQDTALIYLHEIFHNLGLQHEENPFYGDGLTTDNAHQSDAGRQLLRMYRDDVTFP